MGKKHRDFSVSPQLTWLLSRRRYAMADGPDSLGLSACLTPHQGSDVPVTVTGSNRCANLFSPFLNFGYFSNILPTRMLLVPLPEAE